MHGEQVREVGKRAIYWKLGKLKYCMNLEEVMEFSLIKLGTYIKLCGSVDVQSTHSTAELSFKRT